jgi:hypothetical protein
MNYFRPNRSLALRLAGVAAAALFSALASAHHSFALFDMGKMITLSGTVQEWAWANPHATLVVDIVKADGSTEQWSVGGSSPNMMIRWGWNAADINVGDKVQVDVFPARNGQHVAALHTVFLPGGKVLMDPAGQPGKAIASGPQNVPTKPQGQAYK